MPIEKEILTHENIKKDLNRFFYIKIKNHLLTDLIFCPLAFAFISFLVRFLIFAFFDKRISSTFFIIVSLVIILSDLSYVLVKSILSLIKIKCGDYEIKSTWVVDKQSQKRGRRARTPKPYRFIFADTTTYNIPNGKNYRWSKLWDMDEKTLYDYTYLDEEFYRVNVGNEKNVAAYSKKRFEFKK